MKKKKITPEDLELSIEVTGGHQLSPKMIETKNCTPTHGTCDGENGCNTTTPNPTVPDCKTVAEAGCKQTDTCWTIEPECETKVGCVDSASHAQLCCPVSDKADSMCANCMSYGGTCGPDSQCLCMITKKDCETVKLCQMSNGDETCNCTIFGDTCEPPIVHPIETMFC